MTADEERLWLAQRKRERKLEKNAHAATMGGFGLAAQAEKLGQLQAAARNLSETVRHLPRRRG